MQCLEHFSNAKFHAQIEQFFIIMLYLRALDSVVLPLFYSKNWHADLEFA